MAPVRPGVLLPGRRRRARPPSSPTPGGTSSCRTGSAIRSATPRPSATTATTCWSRRPAIRSATWSRPASATPDDRLTADGNDYRVLAPRLVSDPNRNRAAVAFDTLGRVAGTAVMGKPEERLGDSPGRLRPRPGARGGRPRTSPTRSPARTDLLGQATTRVLYDLDAYRRTRHGPAAAGRGRGARPRDARQRPGARASARRSSVRSATPTASAGRSSTRARPRPGRSTDGGPDVEHRWIGSGWTVFNNKGQPVRKYEPFFTATPGFEFARAVGVSAVLFYDPVGRVVATLHPDDSYDKTVFDPWHQADLGRQRHRAARPARGPGRGAATSAATSPCSASSRAAGRPGTRSASAARSARPSSAPPSRPRRTPAPRPGPGSTRSAGPS